MNALKGKEKNKKAIWRSVSFILVLYVFLMQGVHAFDEDEYTSLQTIEEQAEYLIQNYNEEYAREVLLSYADPELTEVHLTSIEDFSNLQDQDIFLASLETDEGVQTLNTNKYLFSQYLSEYGVSFDEEPEGSFGGYDSQSESFITKGKQSTSFSVEVLDNMQQMGFNAFNIAQDGSLVFEGFTENEFLKGESIIGSGEFVSTGAGSVILSQGNIYIEQLDGKIELPDTCTSCYVELYDDRIVVSGKNVLLPSEGVLLAGEVEYYSSTYLVLKEGSKMRTSAELTYEVTEDTDIFDDDQDHIDNVRTYIQLTSAGELIVDTKGKNNVKITAPEKQSFVYAIGVYTKEGGSVTFTQGSFVGNFQEGTVDIVGIPPLTVNTETGTLSQATFCQTGTAGPACTTKVSEGSKKKIAIGTKYMQEIDMQGSPILSERGYYQVGDAPAEDSVDFQNILAIQAVTGALERGATPGVYDQTTQESVMEWQNNLYNEYAQREIGTFDSTFVDGTWDQETTVASANLLLFEDPTVEYYNEENFDPLYTSLQTRCIAVSGNCATVVMHASGIMLSLKERGLEPTQENIQMLLDEQQAGVPNDYLARAKYYGTSDSAWDMSARIREHGGESLYWREEDGEVTAKELKEDPYYPFDSMQPGDVVGLWYDGILAPEGEDERSNSHVGIIVGVEQETYVYDASSGGVSAYLHEELGIESENIVESIPVYAPDQNGADKRVYTIEGQQYFIENGEETIADIPPGTPLVVERQILVHQTTELHKGYLDQELDQQKMSLYEHMRPAKAPVTPTYEAYVPDTVQSAISVADRNLDQLLGVGRKYLITQEVIEN